jgi:hypothetical protein
VPIDDTHDQPNPEGREHRAQRGLNRLFAHGVILSRAARGREGKPFPSRLSALRGIMGACTTTFHEKSPG